MDDETSLLRVLEERALSFPASLKAITDFLLMEGAGIEAMSMAELAQATYTSKPTLVRFAKQLGFSGWAQFRVAFLKEARAAEADAERLSGVNVNYPFAAGDTPAQAARATIRVRELAANKVADRVEEAPLAEVATAIDTAERLAFFARPPTWYYGYSFAFKLNTVGKSCWVPHAEEADLAYGLFQKGDLAIFSSYSGMLAKEPFSHLDRVRAHGALVVGITSDGSPLARAADVTLTYPPIERYYDKVTGFYSCTCTELWLDAIFSAYYLRHYDVYASDRAQRIAQFEASTAVRDDFGTAR